MSSDICRICLSDELLISSIFQVHPVHSQMLSTIVMSLTKVQIYPHDGLPQKLCSKCLETLDKCIEFVQTCECSDLKLRNSHIDQSNIIFHLNENDKNAINEDDSENRQLLIVEEYSNADLLDIVKKEVKLEQNIYNTKCGEKAKQKQQCFTCGKVMSSRFRLKTHLRTHTGEKPYACTHCDKKFSLAENLRIHLRVHTGEKPLSCEECGQTFAHSAALSVHMRKHSGVTPYCCMLCPRRFRTIGHLQYHTRQHTGEKKFECDACSKAFITKSDLNQHKKSHTGEKPHVCSICGLCLTRSSHLKRHIQLKHKTEVEYSCEHCSAKFYQKCLMENHMKEHTNIIDGTSK